MKTLIVLFCSSALIMASSLASARDLGPDEVLKLRDAGTIKAFDGLNQAALAKHPGSRITGTELEEEYGRYVYQVELRDAKGVEWDLEFDASTGELLRDYQDK